MFGFSGPVESEFYLISGTILLNNRGLLWSESTRPSRQQADLGLRQQRNGGHLARTDTEDRWCD